MPPPSARSSAAQRPNGYTLEWAEHELEPADGLVENPTWQDVEAIIGNLTVGEEPRGFVILRDDAGRPVMRRESLTSGTHVSAEFADGRARLTAD